MAEFLPLIASDGQSGFLSFRIYDAIEIICSFISAFIRKRIYIPTQIAGHALTYLGLQSVGKGITKKNIKERSAEGRLTGYFNC